uniref:Uncharacterized protein n=1 Tax=Ralstonia solanacearum TaxID=305 RepID=A0A0S4TMT9_RALSL|nr:protein of unknown function [Ralstonia solanacearum]
MTDNCLALALGNCGLAAKLAADFFRVKVVPGDA